MKNDIFSQLDAELAHAGEETALSPAMLLLEQLRITPEKQLKPMEFLFRLFGKPCFPRGELVAITGKAKSGKTFVTSMLMAKSLTQKSLTPKSLTPKSLTPKSLTPDPSPKGEGSIYTCNDRLPSLHRVREERLKVLWYDTEQSDESTQNILKNRVLRMISDPTPTPSPTMGGERLPHTDSAGTPHPSKNPSPTMGEERLPHTDSAGTPRPFEGRGQGWGNPLMCDVFNVRAVEWKQRRSLLLEAVRKCKPDLVIVDGIRDLVNDINDGVLAQEVMEELLHLATQGNCCIVCVLHQNKSGEDRNLRGWIGTELMNKAFEVYACEKLMPQRIFKLEQTLTRKYDIEQTLYFEVGEDGLPREASPSPIPEHSSPTRSLSEGGEKRHEERLPQLNAEYILHDDAAQGGWQFDVMRLFLDAMRGRDEIGGGELRERVMQLSGIVVPFKYNKLLEQALEQKVIEKSMRDGRTIYRPAPF